jgi:hypothetical protein
MGRDGVTDCRETRKAARNPCEPNHEPTTLELQRRVLDHARLNRLPDATNLGIRSSCMHAPDPRTGGDKRTGEDEGQVLTARPRERKLAVPNGFAYRNGFARHERFIRREMAPLDDRAVRWDAVAFGKHDQIVTNELAARNPFAHPVSDDERARTRKISKRFESVLSLPLLNERENHDEHHEAEEHDGFLPIAECGVDAATYEEQERHRLAHERENAGHKCAAFAGWKLVPTIARTSLKHFFLAQAMKRIRGPRALRDEIRDHFSARPVQEASVVARR